MLEGSSETAGTIKLVDAASTWNNPRVLSRRYSLNSVTLLSRESEQITYPSLPFRFRTQPHFKSKAVIDYIIRSEMFSPEKIPLLFMYNITPHAAGVELAFKYKMNDKWQEKLTDVDIAVSLADQLVVFECRSKPNAHSFRNNKVTWKTGEITQKASNSKGKIVLELSKYNVPPNKLVKHIKLSMKSPTGLLPKLKAECIQEGGAHSVAERLLLIEYKIMPYTQHE